ncbi:ribosome hibernation-promoting factor, HPF/YfiA family [Lacinutrix sp.]|uniref:ribosome hibernation-promoting factor, HPF/YfiA family n=1 Tax=Lacinutrix sp. TaxID=1937692 RepID=UPI0035C837F1
MKVNTQAVNFNVNQELLDFIQQKMNKLDTFYDKVIKSDVFLKVENTSDKENKIFEARISVPGDSFVVKKQCKTFEEGVDIAVASLERQLKKRKAKLRAHL